MKYEQIQEILKNQSFIENIDILSNKNIRIQTSFLYQDRSCIDIFIKNETNILTDFGTSLAFCFDYLLKCDDKFNSSIEENLLYGEEIAKFSGGCLELSTSPDTLIKDIITISQLCIKISVYIHCVNLCKRNELLTT